MSGHAEPSQQLAHIVPKKTVVLQRPQVRALLQPRAVRCRVLLHPLLGFGARRAPGRHLRVGACVAGLPARLLALRAGGQLDRTAEGLLMDAGPHHFIVGERAPGPAHQRQAAQIGRRQESQDVLRDFQRKQPVFHLLD